jgi:hypothetical protein
MSNIAQERFYNGESSLISIDIHDRIDVAELQERLPPGFDRGHAGAKVVRRLPRDVIVDFAAQDILVPNGGRPRSQPLKEPPQRFHFRS